MTVLVATATATVAVTAVLLVLSGWLASRDGDR